MTTRDSQIIDYVRRAVYVETDVLYSKFFNSLHRAQVRLKQLVDAGQLKRHRYDSRKNFVYMLPSTKVTTQLEHLAIVSRLFPYFEELGYMVLHCDYEVELVKQKGYREGIRCDAIFVVQGTSDLPLVYIIECERCHTAISDKIVKYEQYAKNKEYLDKFPTGMPNLLIITDNKLPYTELSNVYALPLQFYRSES